MDSLNYNDINNFTERFLVYNFTERFLVLSPPLGHQRAALTVALDARHRGRPWGPPFGAQAADLEPVIASHSLALTKTLPSSAAFREKDNFCNGSFVAGTPNPITGITVLELFEIATDTKTASHAPRLWPGEVIDGGVRENGALGRQRFKLQTFPEGHVWAAIRQVVFLVFLVRCVVG